MKTVFKIAKTELLNLFYSPIAWFLMIVFLMQCNLSYIEVLGNNARTQEIGGIGLRYMFELTSRIFGGRYGVFPNVMQKLYLYIPLLTMGLISREMNSGTIKLLYSSPVKIWQIVFGKYLSMLVYSLLMICMLGILILAGSMNIRHADVGMLLAAAFGFYLLLCAYAAIGIFMSSLTTYQVVAAVATFVMIGFLSYVGQLWQGVDFVRDLTYFLSMSGRTQNMLGGLISSKDVLYFVIIVYIFLGLTILKLRSGMESKPWTVKAARYIAVVLSGVMIGYVTGRPSLAFYYDATANKTRTISEASQKILKTLGKEKVEVTTYNNLLGNYYYLGLPEQRNVLLSLWEPYLRFKPDIDFKFVNYYDTSYDNARMMFASYKGKGVKDIAAQIAKSSDLNLADFKTPQEIHIIVDLRPELNRFVMQVKYRGRSTFLRIFDDQFVFPAEPEVGAALKRLLQDKMPRALFLTGELERNVNKTGDRDLITQARATTFRYALINQGFDIDTLDANVSGIPQDISALVIADPRVAFSATVLDKIKHYIDAGGNLIVLAETGKQAVINPLLQHIGVQLMDGTLVQPSDDQSPDLVLAGITPLAAKFTAAIGRQYDDTIPVSMPSAAPLWYTADSGFTVEPLLVTNAKNSWLKKGKLVADSGAVKFSPAEGDVQQSFATALGLSRKVNGKEQRIVVVGDADVMSNGELSRSNIQTANFQFNTALFSWLSNGEFPIEATRPDSQDRRVNISTEGVARLKILLVWILPALVLLAGAILLIRRRRK
ncbi:ABC transporter [Chitinophaga parva]|uniref:ABC transporter n=1 Tax=Chitinophaga parva TaxID=2169414 RepID=A0A2T7BHN3_9BACT|nr:Gldg family protein [Chitinophaga parva]PUZ25778.1 ABC transporter [Chitinophaga parva]